MLSSADDSAAEAGTAVAAAAAAATAITVRPLRTFMECSLITAAGLRPCFVGGH